MKISPRYKPELCASRDETRYHLTQSYFDAEKSRMVATDGHMLCVVPCLDASTLDKSGHVPAAALKAARKLKTPEKRGKGARGGNIVIAESMAMLDLSTIVSAKDSTGATYPRHVTNFPPVDSVIPRPADFKKAYTFAFNAHLLSAIAEAIGTDGQVSVTVDTTNPLQPILVKALAKDNEALGVLMPCDESRRA